MDVYTVIGLAGFVAYLAGYALLQAGVIDGNAAAYPLINLTAASLVFVSLLQAFNLASALIQVSWILVSIFGLWRQGVARAAIGGNRSTGRPTNARPADAKTADQVLAS